MVYDDNSELRKSSATVEARWTMVKWKFSKKKTPLELRRLWRPNFENHYTKQIRVSLTHILNRKNRQSYTQTLRVWMTGYSDCQKRPDTTSCVRRLAVVCCRPLSHYVVVSYYGGIPTPSNSYLYTTTIETEYEYTIQ